MEKVIERISDIPYCGSMNIEGYLDESGNVAEYWGTNNPSNDFSNPGYFRATWGHGQHGTAGQYNED